MYLDNSLNYSRSKRACALWAGWVGIKHLTRGERIHFVVKPNRHDFIMHNRYRPICIATPIRFLQHQHRDQHHSSTNQHRDQHHSSTNQHIQDHSEQGVKNKNVPSGANQRNQWPASTPPWQPMSGTATSNLPQPPSSRSWQHTSSNDQQHHEQDNQKWIQFYSR